MSASSSAMPKNTFAVSDAASRLSRTCALNDAVSRLRYVSASRAAALKRLGIMTVRDLLLHIPRRYLDFTKVVTIACADVGSEVTIIGIVDAIRLKHPRPRLQIVEVDCHDDTGVIRVTFFQQAWIADQLHVGDCVALSGKVVFEYGYKRMKSPFHELVSSRDETFAHTRVLPVHAVGEGISAAWMRRIISAALADVADIVDFLPMSLVSSRALMSEARALRAIHFPRSLAENELARRRLAYDELICLQLALAARRRLEVGEVRPAEHVISGPALSALLQAMPFTLTDEQRQAVDEILADMAAAQVMNRLLLGDVGTGKTAVAAFALAAVADTGTQAAMMAPTSVLAQQYAERLGPLLTAAGISWAILTSATPQAKRSDVTTAIARGAVTVVFGTTALLSHDVGFAHLSLVVIDEQHRFGVDQRLALRDKGVGVDLLAMTATPIPRTLALSLYGDMTCSRIRTRPTAGAGITTRVISPSSLDIAYGAIRSAVAAGHQAYVVCPLVEDGDDGTDLDDVPESVRSNAKRLHSATATAHELSTSVFTQFHVGLLHGRMKEAEKDDVMAQFRAGTLDVLVSTTVIEVGVDVPNATVMLVYDADRFGLATLHQLRGRVGRGDVAGTVYLCCAAKRETPARRRLDALEASSDGFELAELDLKLRHEGEVMGYRQHGGITLSITDLAADADLVTWAHDDMAALIASDPSLSAPHHRPLALEVHDRFNAYFKEAGLR